MNKKIGIFMPARLNSERLPNKIILPMGDSCLFEIACQKLDGLSSNYNKYVLISDKILIDIASKYKNIDIIIRDSETTKRDSPLSYIFKDLNFIPDTHLMFLNPCLAFLTQKTIEENLSLFANSKADYATSVKPLQNWILDANGKALNYVDFEKLTTKEINPLWQFAHCFHIFNKQNFFNDGLMLKENFLMLPIPIEETIDVDTREEYLYAKWKYEQILY